NTGNQAGHKKRVAQHPTPAARAKRHSRAAPDSQAQPKHRKVIDSGHAGPSPPECPLERDHRPAPAKGPTVKGTLSPRHLLRALALALAALAATAAAREGAVTEYPLHQLNVQPGLLALGPNCLTLLEFPDLVETVATGRADLIQVEVDDNRILLRPTRSNGRTDLIVKVSGVNALFTI